MKTMFIVYDSVYLQQFREWLVKFNFISILRNHFEHVLCIRLNTVLALDPCFCRYSYNFQIVNYFAFTQTKLFYGRNEWDCKIFRNIWKYFDCKITYYFKYRTDLFVLLVPLCVHCVSTQNGGVSYHNSTLRHTGQLNWLSK